jgi:hypothetical protein
MALDRGRLEKIDRRVFAELDHCHGVQMVKVPVLDAVWSTRRRYCEALVLSMGEGVARLILHKLETVVDNRGTGTGTFTDQMSRQEEERASDLDARQRVLDTRAEQLRAKEEHLRAWEQRMRIPRPAGRSDPVRSEGGSE